MNFIIFCIAFILIFGGWDQIIQIIQQGILSRERMKLAEFRTRRIEAFARLPEAERKVVMETMSEWLDPDGRSGLE